MDTWFTKDMKTNLFSEYSKSDFIESKGSRVSLQNISLRFIKYRNKKAKFKEAILSRLFSGSGVMRPDEEFWVLKNISLDVKTGQRLGIIGANGAGKSTLLRLIAGIYPPTTGCIEVSGNIGPLIDIQAGFNHEVSASENIILYGSLLGHSLNEMVRKKDKILSFAGVEKFANMPTKYYSTGMLKRLALSLATDIMPDILLIDEIFAGGDVTFKKKAKKRMLELIDGAKIMIMVSHNLDLIKDLCNQCIWLHKGSINAIGKTCDVIEQYLANESS